MTKEQRRIVTNLVDNWALRNVPETARWQMGHRAYGQEGDKVKNNDGDIKICPFYIFGTKLSVSCEGAGLGQKKIMIKFCTEKGRRDWQKKYCSQMGYQDCPYAKMIERKYKR